MINIKRHYPFLTFVIVVVLLGTPFVGTADSDDEPRSAAAYGVDTIGSNCTAAVAQFCLTITNSRLANCHRPRPEQFDSVEYDH